MSHPFQNQKEDTLVYDIPPRRYINFHDRCTLACTFCPKTNGSKTLQHHNLKLYKRPTAQSVIEKLGDVTQYEEVVFCGFGEPTLRLKELLTISHHIKTQGGRVRVNTDGLANKVYKRNVLPELATCVDAISVSLNAQNEETYNHYCQPTLPNSFQAMLDFLKQAPDYIPEVTATAIDGLPGVDISACERLAQSCGAKFRRRVLDILGEETKIDQLRKEIDLIDKNPFFGRPYKNKLKYQN